MSSYVYIRAILIYWANTQTRPLLKGSVCAMDERPPTVIRMREIDGKIINDERRQCASVYDIVTIILSTTVKSKYLTTLFWRRLTVGINLPDTYSGHNGNNPSYTKSALFYEFVSYNH